MPAEEKKWGVIRRWIWITGFVATTFAIALAIALEPSGWIDQIRGFHDR